MSIKRRLVIKTLILKIKPKKSLMKKNQVRTKIWLTKLMRFIDNIKLYERIINGIQNGNQENFEDFEEEYEESEDESNEYLQIENKGTEGDYEIGQIAPQSIDIKRSNTHTNLPPPPDLAKKLLPTPPVTKPQIPKPSKSDKPSLTNSSQHSPAPQSMRIPAPSK